MNAVFADTFFYQALLDERDPSHGHALAQSKVKRTILTTEFILLELGNACARAEDHGDFLALLAGIRASPRTRIISLDSRLLQRGLDLFAGRPPINSATCARAVSITRLIFDPNLYALDGLPYSLEKDK